jgi:hypothetical protein
LGVAYTPRLYARDLTALELASSGRIAAVLNDVFAFDLAEASNSVMFSARSNAGFAFTNGPGDVTFDLGADGSFHLYGSNDSAIRGNNVTVLGSNSLLLKGGDASLTLSDDLTFSAESLAFDAASNLTFTASNQARMFSGSNSLVLDGPAGQITLVAASNINLRASNDITTEATTISTTARQDLAISACNDITLTASNLSGFLGSNLFLAVQSNVRIDASGSNASLQLSDASLWASATQEVSLATGATSNTVISLSAASNSVSISAPSNVSLSTDGLVQVVGEMLEIDVSSNAAITVGDSLELAVAAGSNTLSVDQSGVQWGVTGSVSVSAAGSNVAFRLDAASNMASLSALGDVAVHADQVMTLSGADSNVFLQLHSQSNRLELFAPSNVLIGTDGSMALATNLLDVAVGSNATVAVSNDLSLTTSGASNTLQMSSTGTTASVAGALSITAGASNVSLLATSNTLQVASVGQVGVHSDAALTLSTSNSNAFWILDPAGSNELVAVGSTTTRTTVSSTFVSDKVTVASSNLVEIDAVILNARLSDEAHLYATSNLFVAAANSNVTLKLGSASNTLDISATGDLAIHSDEVLTLSGSNSNVYVRLHSDSNSLTLHAPSNINLFTPEGILSADVFGMDIFASNVARLAASNTLSLGSVSQSVQLSAATSNVTLALDASSDKLTGAATGGIEWTSGANLTVTTSNSTTLYTGSNLTMAANSSNQYLTMAGSNLTLFAANQMNLQATSYVMDAASNHVFNVNGVEVLRLSSNNMTLRGNIDLTGTINTIITEETILQVEDKLIRVSYNSNGVIDGLLTNDGSGLQVVGTPEPFPTESNEVRFNKSLTWNYGSSSSNAGTMYLGTSNLDESFWQVRGGSLRLTVTKSNGSDVSFGFRINDFDELELVKYYTSNAVPQKKRVAKFGKQLA